MAKDLLLIALKRNLATAEELGQTDRAKALKKRIAVHEKSSAPPEPAAEIPAPAAVAPAEPSKPAAKNPKEN